MKYTISIGFKSSSKALIKHFDFQLFKLIKYIKGYTISWIQSIFSRIDEHNNYQVAALLIENNSKLKL